MYTFHSFNIFSETALPRPPAVPQHHHSQAVMPWQYLALALQRYYIFLKNRPIIHQKPRICISIIYIFDIFRRGGILRLKNGIMMSIIPLHVVKSYKDKEYTFLPVCLLQWTQYLTAHSFLSSWALYLLYLIFISIWTFYYTYFLQSFTKAIKKPKKAP